MPRPRLSHVLVLLVVALIGLVALLLPRRAGVPQPPAPLPVELDATGFAFGRFGALTVLRPADAPTSVVLYLSGEAGWDAAMTERARPLAERGALVAGIDYPRFRAAVERDGAPCLYLSSDFEDLSRAVQAHYHLAQVRPPLLAGIGAGATMAYAILVQQPPGTFAGALNLGFSPVVALDKELCGAYLLRSHPVAGTADRYALEPAAPPAPWIVLQGAADTASASAGVPAFAAAVTGAHHSVVPGVDGAYHLTPDWREAYLAAFDTLAADATRADRSEAPANLADLPLVEVPATREGGDRMAVLLTGDGGWAGLDREVADTLAAQGIPVVGVSTLKYFWSAKSPEQTAVDLGRIIDTYVSRWLKPSVIVIGYSMGAEVLPFAINRLPDATRARIAYAAALAPGPTATFEFHVSNWMADTDDGLPVAPEIGRLGVPLLCIAGEGDDDNACTPLDRRRFRVVTLPGNHHFGGDYQRVTETILAGAAPD